MQSTKRMTVLETGGAAAPAGWSPGWRPTSQKSAAAAIAISPPSAIGSVFRTRLMAMIYSGRSLGFGNI